MPDFLDTLHVAGLVVRVTGPGVRTRLGLVPGLEVHVEAADARRLVVTIERPTADDLKAAHEALLRMPGVVAADLVCHLADGDGRVPAAAGV